MKKNKIKKYNSGVAKLKANLETEGGVQATGMIGAGLGMGITALTKPKANSKLHESKYTSQLKDADQNTGKAIGSTIGAGLGMINPALGAIATPVLSAVGGAIQGGLQKNKLKQIKTDTDRAEANEEFNDSLSSTSIQQAKQFKKGGKATQQVIEIEGKTTPEIHTDKNFNLKNLGTTPHSKGGDKVLAEEGDVVFPTQNSKAKYNKVMKALREKDIPSLKREQAKLPKDGGKKYATGVNSIDLDDETPEETPEERIKRLEAENLKNRKSILGNAARYIGDVWDNNISDPLRTASLREHREWYKSVHGDELYKLKFGVSPEKDPVYTGKKIDISKYDANLFSSNNSFDLKSKLKKDNSPVTSPASNKTEEKTEEKSADDILKETKVALNGGNKGGGKTTTTPKVKTGEDPLMRGLQGIVGMPKDLQDGYDGPTTKKYVQAFNTGRSAPRPEYGSKEEKAMLEGIDYEEGLGDAKARAAYEKGIKDGTIEPAMTAAEFMKNNKAPEDGPEKVGYGAGLDTAMELAPIASNLGKGLFGKVEKVERNYLTPETEKYTDLSASARAKSSQMYNAQKNNARNASGGSLGNMRSNMQQASNDEAGRQTDINNQEVARQTDINSRNNQLVNNAKGINLDLKNKYNEIDAGSRAAKSGLLSAGLTGLSELGAKNKMERNERNAQKTELDIWSQNSVYKIDGKEIRFKDVEALPYGERRLIEQKIEKQVKGKSGKKN
jgi:hypothetical protein